MRSAVHPAVPGRAGGSPALRRCRGGAGMGRRAASPGRCLGLRAMERGGPARPRARGRAGGEAGLMHRGSRAPSLSGTIVSSLLVPRGRASCAGVLRGAEPGLQRRGTWTPRGPGEPLISAPFARENGGGCCCWVWFRCWAPVCPPGSPMQVSGPARRPGTTGRYLDSRSSPFQPGLDSLRSWGREAGDLPTVPASTACLLGLK